MYITLRCLSALREESRDTRRGTALHPHQDAHSLFLPLIFRNVNCSTLRQCILYLLEPRQRAPPRILTQQAHVLVIVFHWLDKGGKLLLPRYWNVSQHHQHDGRAAIPCQVRITCIFCIHFFSLFFPLLLLSGATWIIISPQTFFHRPPSKRRPRNRRGEPSAHLKRNPV